MYIFAMRALALALAVVATLAVGACSDSATPPIETPPAIPPQASMEPDLAFFEGNPLAGDSSTGVVAGSWFISAVIAVSVAKAATFLTLAVPATTFAAAFSQQPVFSGGAFHWEYSVAGPFYSYQVDVSARPVETQSSWEMRVTSATHIPALNNFLWASGTSSLVADQGEWRVFDAGNPAVRREVLRVDWTYLGPFVRSLTLTNVDATSSSAGDQLGFEVAGVIATMQFFDASAQTQVLVQWNIVTYEGLIVAPNVNGGLPACWNRNLVNTPCS